MPLPQLVNGRSFTAPPPSSEWQVSYCPSPKSSEWQVSYCSPLLIECWVSYIPCCNLSYCDISIYIGHVCSSSSPQPFIYRWLSSHYQDPLRTIRPCCLQYWLHTRDQFDMIVREFMVIILVLPCTIGVLKTAAQIARFLQYHDVKETPAVMAVVDKQLYYWHYYSNVTSNVDSQSGQLQGSACPLPHHNQAITIVVITSACMCLLFV